MALILAALAVVYVLVQRAGGAQDQHRPGRRRAATTTTSTAASATCSATSPWCRAMRASPPRCRPCAASSAELLAAQYPVLTWWGLLTVLTRIGRHHQRGGHLRRRRRAGRARRDHGRRDRGVRRLRRPADRQARSAVGLRRAHLPVRADPAQLLRSARRHRRRAREARRQAARGRGRQRALRDVTFRFRNSDQGVFDASFEAPAGKTVALVGPTGAGKTTTLALLQRLRAPNSGRILVDGVDIADVTLSLVAAQHRRRVPGRRPVQPLDRREHPRRPAGRDRRRGRAGRPARRGARVHLQEARAATSS